MKYFFSILLAIALCAPMASAQSAIGQLQNMTGQKINTSHPPMWSGSTSSSSSSPAMGMAVGLIGSFLGNLLSTPSTSSTPSTPAYTPSSPSQPAAPVIEEYLKAEDRSLDYPVEDAGVEGLKMFLRYPATYDDGWFLQMGYTNESEISRDAIIVYQEKVVRNGTPVTKVLRTGFPGNHLGAPITTPVVHGNYKDDATTRYRILAIYCQ